MQGGTPGQRMNAAILVIAFCLLVNAGCAQNTKEETPKAAQSIAELRQQLERVLQGMHTPGMSVAIVRRDGPEWVAGLGKSDVAANRATTNETLFRIGSTSKAFVSLSILKLVNEGKLSLQDPVHKVAPEIWFENRWEATDPVRVVDLLEHTTGWDEMHLREYGKDAKGMTLREGLDDDRHSRVSRWPPGTRMAYCNSGPSVAAYIVEKITGQRFEDYVTQNLFLPIGMKTATYFEQPSPQLTTLYASDGKTPNPYWNILLRPAGAINASAKDMAAYVGFYLNRGLVGGIQVIPPASMDRMEVPTRTWAAQEGLKAGYGLSNYWSVHDGFAYHGHHGGVNGGLTDMSYLSEYGVGYFYSINSGNDAAFGKIGEAIRAYITRGLAKPAVPAAARDYAGWYQPDSPRMEMLYFIEHLLGISQVRFEGGKLLMSSLRGKNQVFVPVQGMQFRFLPKQGPAEPIATAELLAPNSEARLVQFGAGTSTLKRIPLSWVIAEAVLVAWFLLAVLSILLYAPFWILGGLSKKRRRPVERAIRLWPLIAVLSLVTFGGLLMLASNDPFARLGNMTVWSFGLFLTTAAYGVGSLASAVALGRATKQEVRRSVGWHSIAATAPLLIAVAYLAYWGVIGIRTWG